MIGEIFAGVLLGPVFLNLINRGAAFNMLSDLGALFLVIMVGLGISVNDLTKILFSKVILIGILAFLIPFLCGIGVGIYFNQGIFSSLVIGLCIAMTALPVSIKILHELGLVDSEMGRCIISAAIFDDVVAFILFGIISNFIKSGSSSGSIIIASFASVFKGLILLVLLFLVNYGSNWLLKKENLAERFSRRLNNSSVSMFSIFFFFILLFSAITELLGFHFIIGAFWGSLFVSDKIIGEQNFNKIKMACSALSISLFTPFFFVNLGAEFRYDSISNAGLLFSILLFSYLSKIMGGYLGGILIGQSKKLSLLIGTGLNGRGIMEIVIAKIAYEEKLINPEIFSILIIIGIVTTLTTPIMLKSILRPKQMKFLPENAIGETEKRRIKTDISTNQRESHLI